MGTNHSLHRVAEKIKWDAYCQASSKTEVWYLWKGPSSSFPTSSRNHKSLTATGIFKNPLKSHMGSSQGLVVRSYSSFFFFWRGAKVILNSQFHHLHCYNALSHPVWNFHSNFTLPVTSFKRKHKAIPMVPLTKIIVGPVFTESVSFHRIPAEEAEEVKEYHSCLKMSKWEPER